MWFIILVTMESECNSEWLDHYNKMIMKISDKLDIEDIIENKFFNEGLMCLIPKHVRHVRTMDGDNTREHREWKFRRIYHVLSESPVLTFEYIIEHPCLPWHWMTIIKNRKFSVEQFVMIINLAYHFWHDETPVVYIDFNTNISIYDVIDISKNFNTNDDEMLISFMDRKDFTVHVIMKYQEFDWFDAWNEAGKKSHIPPGFFDTITSEDLLLLGKNTIQAAHLADYNLSDIKTRFPNEFKIIIDAYGSNPLESSLDSIDSKNKLCYFDYEREIFVKKFYRRKHFVLFRKCLIEMIGVFLNPDNFEFNKTVELELGIPTDEEWKRLLKIINVS